MDAKRRRKTLDWKEVFALRRSCVQCGAQPGCPCRNYRGQRKFTCAGRLSDVVIPQPAGAGPKQRDLFAPPSATVEGGL